MNTGALFSQFDYYPFGSVMQGRLYSSGAYRYGFNGKEKETDGTTDNYDFGARIYDGRLGRFLSVDDKLLIHPDLTTFRFGLNNPLFFVDKDGNTEYQFYTRNFIPVAQILVDPGSLETTKKAFKGDNRGFSPWLNQTARVHNKLTVDTESEDYVAARTKTWCSHTIILIDDNPMIQKTAMPQVEKAREVQAVDGNITIGQKYSASDPLAPGAPDIDFDVSITIKEDKTAGTVEFHSLVTGDKYPATEQFVIDPSGKKLFLGVSPAVGSIVDAYGDGTKTNTLISSYTKVKTDAQGNFLAVLDGTKEVTIDEWNKKFTTTPATAPAAPAESKK